MSPKNRRIGASLGLALIWVASVGCRGEPPAAPAVTQLTQAEAEAFGRAFVEHVSRCDSAALEEDIDADAIVARAVADRRVSDKQIADARKGLRGTDRCANATGETYTYLRTQMIGGRPQPMLRSIAGAAGFNYVRLQLAKRGGRVRAVDEYYFSSGTWTTETIRMTVDAKERQFAATLERIDDARRAGKRDEARALLRALPADVRTTKLMMTAELNLFDPGDPKYLVALDAFAKTFAGDPSMVFHEIDRNLLHKDFDGLLGAIARLDAVVGGDPYLDVVRAAVFRMLGKRSDAIAAAKRATSAEPTLRDAWMVLASLQIASKDFAGALRTLEVLRDRFGMRTDAASLRTVDELAELPDTPEYAEWSKRQ